MSLTSYENWQAAWAHYAADEPQYAPTPEEAAFMQQHMGNGSCTAWCLEDAMGLEEPYPDDPGMVGNVLSTLTVRHEDGTSNILSAYANGVYATIGDESMVAGVQIAYLKQ